MRKRWASRKFLTALAAQAAGLLVLFWPEQEEAIRQAAQSVAGLAAVVLSALGYAAAEASVDRKRGGRDAPQSG